MQKKGILLFSGGLDSLLAVKVLQQQNIELVGINFLLPFEHSFSGTQDAIQRYADDLVLNIRFIDCSDEYVPMLKNPPHGYGKNINPCIDCKILFQKLAKKIMKEEDAAFIATGEVNGQRPMSQRRDMITHIEKEAGTSGYILRPLSIRFFPPTFAEEAGIVDRSKLLSFHGRGRHAQLDLAKKYGITEFATPAGGCLFTEPNYSNKLRFLMKQHPEFTALDLKLLRIGRHFSLGDQSRILVTRNEEEAKIAEKFKDAADLVAEPSFKGPIVLGFGNFDDSALQKIADIAGRYGKFSGTENEVVTLIYNSDTLSLIPESLPEEELDSMRI